MLSRDIYGQPNSADPVLDQHIVLELVRRHQPAASEVTGVDESGGEARTYAVDGDIILKTQRPHRVRPRTNLAKEVFFLTQLAAHPEISVPRVLGYGKEGDIEYICMTRMPGVAAQNVEVKTAKRTAVLHRLGRTLRKIHSLTQAPFYESALFPGFRTQEEFAERVRAGFEQSLRGIRENSIPWPLAISPEALASKAIEMLPSHVDLVALHSNPSPMHTFVRPDTHDFVGIIDFGDAYISHPALDWRWPSHADRLATLAGYCEVEPVSDDFMAAWHSLLVLSDMSSLVAWPQRRNQALDRLGDLLPSLG